MKSNNKIDVLDDLKKVLLDVDYFDFLKIVNGCKKEIKNVDTKPIDNFTHGIADLCSREYFVTLYQHIKYYLEQKQLYGSKFQEGLALCVSKTIIINNNDVKKINNYLTFGNDASNEKINPLEEVARIFLISLKAETNSNNFGERIDKGEDDNQNEVNLFCNIIAKALNGESLYRQVKRFSKGTIIDDISMDLESSTIDSANPLNTREQSNKEILNRQFERIYDLYDAKTNYRILIGDLYQSYDTISPLIDFNNKIAYAKRNIGLTSKTKQLKK